MSRLYEALSRLKMEQQTLAATSPAAVPPPSMQEAKTDHRSLQVVPLTMASLGVISPKPVQEAEILKKAEPKTAETEQPLALLRSASPESRLVALTDPNGLGAEKFRALVTRLDHMRSQRQLKSFQVTSSVIDEGKTLVAGNIAVTLAKYTGSRTLVVEGDLRRPTLEKLFGLSTLPGIGQWWYGQDQYLDHFVHQLNDMPLWFLSAGAACDQPSDLLRSERFEKAFSQLADKFDWIVVDSTPMLPIIDVNLWSKLLDGTLLVVREGVTPIKTLKRGLQALDHPNLIGVVVNEATEFDQGSYESQYYLGSNSLSNRPRKDDDPRV